MKKQLLVCLLALLLAIFPLCSCGSESEIARLDDNATYKAEIVVKDYGTIVVTLDQKAAPITTANFVSLARRGFYDGLTFHRVMKGILMQGGDPQGNGYGGSENTIKGEFSSNGVDNPLSHTRGAISMARSKGKDSASSQFFIVQNDYPAWDGQYAAFGYVTEGMDVVDAFCSRTITDDPNGMVAPINQPVISSITIRES